MSYEQKYEEALKRASNLKVQNPFDTVGQMVEHIFPELKGSEDERIRKAIHIYLDWLDGRKDYAPKGIYSIKDMIAWVVKQGENKKLDADKVIEWLNDQACLGWIEDIEVEKFVEQFKKDFEL